MKHEDGGDGRVAAHAPRSWHGLWPFDTFGQGLTLWGVCVLALLMIGLAGWHPRVLLSLSALSAAVAVTFAVLRQSRPAPRSVQSPEPMEDVNARMALIISSAMDAIITVDSSYRIVQFNAAAETLFGCDARSAMGSGIDRFIPERFRATHGEHMRRFGATGATSRRMGRERLITGVHSDGHEFPIDASISHITGHGSKYYTVILRDISERMHAENELRRSRAELREFAAAAHTVREQEKSRIARELHDELGQALTALKMDVGWLDAHLAPDAAPLRDKLRRMESLLSDTVTATRRISAELRPLILDDLGVIAATEWLVDNFQQRSGIRCELYVSDPDLSWQDPLASGIFRIVQESLTNIARHSGATAARIDIRQEGDGVHLSISDDGIGFDAGNPRKPKSFGLLGLRERVHLLGGDLAIQSGAGVGTRIEVRLPTQLPPQVSE